MTQIGVAIRLFLAFAAILVFLEVCDSYDKKVKADHIRGVQESIGRPMKYAEVPVGEYTVVAVVENYKPYTAVVRKDSRAVGYVAPQYLLVTDLMPNMMTKHFVFTVGGNAK